MIGQSVKQAVLGLCSAAFLVVATFGAVPVQALELPENDYPTAARADYIFGCMAVNGQNRDVLIRCSCSIDTIAELLPFAKYEEAETLLSVSQRGGENSTFMITAPILKEKVRELRRAQVEAELRCF